MLIDSQIVPWYKQRWPWLLIAGPAFVIIAGAVTVWLAVVSNDGLVVDDYYKQGLAVNQRLHRDQQASTLGFDCRFDAIRDKHQTAFGCWRSNCDAARDGCQIFPSNAGWARSDRKNDNGSSGVLLWKVGLKSSLDAGL